MTAGWRTKPLGEVLRPTETIDPTRSPDSEFEYIDVSSISNSTFQIETTQHLKGRDAPSRARRRVETDDILFATIRPTLKRIAVVPARLTGQVCSTGYIVLRATSALDHRFLFHWLFTRGFLDQMASLQKGASYPAVTEGEVRAQPIPLPPLPEQHRIVAILDQAFEAIATARVNTQRNIENARALFESHLDAVLSSPASWNQRPLGDLCDILDSRRRPITKRDRTPGEIPYYGATGIQDYVRDFIFDEPLVLVGEDGAKWGSGESTAFLVSGKCWVNNHAHVLRPNRTVLLDQWLAYVLNHSDLSEFVSGLTVPKLNQGSLREIPVPVPPMAIQERLTRVAAEVETEIDRLESLYQQKVTALDNLRESILHHAFTGQL